MVMARRQRSSFGCVQRIGRDRYRLRWWEDTPDGYRRVSETFDGTRKAAERRMAEIRVSLDERARRHSPMTVGEAYRTWWLPDAEQRVTDGRLAKSTFKMRMSTWRLRVSEWSETACADVRPLDIQRWLDPMTKKPAVDALSLLRQILDYAATYDVVGENVARRAYRMPQAHESLKDGAYTLDELDRIASAARGAHTEAALLLMCFASCRTGESLGPRLDECRAVTYRGLTLAVVDVVRQVYSDAQLGPDGQLKNRQSVRPVVVPPPWSARLLELVGQKRARGETWMSDDGAGRPLSQNLLRREWSRAVQDACVPPKQPRAARRSWETYMRWDMGVAPDKVERMMGHAIPGVTGEHYDKPTAKAYVETVGEVFCRKPFARKS